MPEASSIGLGIGYWEIISNTQFFYAVFSSFFNAKRASP